MKKLFVKAVSFSALIILIACGITVYCLAGDSDSENGLPEGVYMKLNKEFYDSLSNNDKYTYSNNKSTEYLRDISISSKFMVETNLQIIRQQEEIIRLLETIADKKKK